MLQTPAVAASTEMASITPVAQASVGFDFATNQVFLLKKLDSQH
jgi:hypothetical protein